MIKVSAPGKLMLFGEHAVIHGRPCIVTSVDHRINVFLEKKDDKKIYLDAPDINIKDYIVPIDDLDKSHPKETRFVLVTIKNFFERYNFKNGLNIKTKSDSLDRFGLGSSSAVIVSTIKGLAELFKIRIGEKELFNLSYKTVLDIQKVGSGFDVATAIHGGTLFFVTAGKTIEPIKIAEPPIIIGFSGIKADTPTLVRMVYKKLSEEPRKINKTFDEIEEIVKLARVELESSDWKRVGELMNLNQNLLRGLDVSSEKLENLIKAALDAGAYGAKLSGAGGGDCMIAITSKEKMDDVKTAIQKSGGKVIELKIQTKGVRLE